MKNGAIFRLLHGCYLIVAYKLVYLPDKWEFGGYARQRFRFLLRGYSAKVLQRQDKNVPDKWELFIMKLKLIIY